MTMKISLWLPLGVADPRRFLLGEIAESKNIQDKANRKAVLRGLQKLVNAVMTRAEGVAYYTDGDEVSAEDYNGTQRLYYCGREYKRPDVKAFDPYLLVVIDAQEAAIGTTDGERIKVLWTDTSFVPGKHCRGGQSKERFQRGREEALKHWLRKVLELVTFHHGGRRIVVGGPGMTKDLFLKEFPSWLHEKVVRVDSVGYTNENGLWELMGKSRYQ